ncbi:D-lyxose/D-mannose family sugar isomerase [Gammaproteobacteria bacterium]|nr:D-lyxose/D-mannose family sugar isomerase [Gammaproteobacteria bacterium]
MKRTEINQIMRNGAEFIADHSFRLPPFSSWSFADWEAHLLDAEEIVRGGLGWDVTDFGNDDFEGSGVLLFTLRNGELPARNAPLGRCYGEKLLVVRDQQMVPLHYHLHKTEDIINRSGGNLSVRLFDTHADGGIDHEHKVTVMCDGLYRTVDAGGIVRLEPGESITLMPGIAHAFWGEGDVLLGEVSSVNDDHNDNYFAETMARFPTIEEDEEPWRLLVSDYRHLQI